MASRVGKVRLRGSVRARVLVIVLIPALSLVFIGIGFSGYLLKQGQQMRTFAQSTTRLAAPDSQMMIALQQERLLSVQKLVGVQGLDGALAERRKQTDAALTTVMGLAAGMADSGGGQVGQVMSGFSALAARLPQLRVGVDSGQVPLATVYSAYNAILDNGVASMQAYLNTAPDTGVAAEVQTSLQVYLVSDSLSRSAALGTAVAARAVLPRALINEYVQQVGFYHQQLVHTLPLLAPQERQRIQALTDSAAWARLAAAESRLLAIATTTTTTTTETDGTGRRLPAPSAAWVDAALLVSSGLLDVFRAQGARAADLITDNGDRTFTRSLYGALGVLALTLLTILIAVRLSNRLIRRLSRLQADTLGAGERIHEVAARVQTGEHVDADVEVPAREYGSDEIGQLAAAFNFAQRSAVRATIAEARTRVGTQAAFLAIAHRSQVLIHRQLEVLDQAERSLEDPDQLKMLFELDHLATRARRNAENLIILAGERPGRQWRRPVPLAEVVRGAVAETEHYTRVTTTPIPDLWVDGAVVADLVHLLAELVDNATAFSPPTSTVEVRTGIAGRGLVVEVEDRGLGIEPAAMEALNATLHDPPEFDVLALSTESRLGVFVVARLAARLDIRVTLTDSPYGGVRAVVLVPSAALTPAAGNGSGAGANAAAPEPLTRRQRRLTASPVAQLPDQSAPRDGQVTGAYPKPPQPDRPTAPDSTRIVSATPRVPRPEPRDAPVSPAPDPVASLGPVASPDASPGDGPGDGPSAGEVPSGAPSTNGSVGYPAEPDTTPLVLRSPSSGRTVEEPAEAPSEDYPPPLPRRQRQTHLHTVLDVDDSDAAPEVTHLDWVSPERARSQLSAFQRGSRQGRSTPPL